MPTIFEIFSYPITYNSAAAVAARSSAHCSFMNAECDGGGNRDLSTVDLSKNEDLAAYFPGKNHVCAGVCSIQMKHDASPWIVCPRRLLALNREANESLVQRQSEKRVVKLLDYPAGERLGIWSEVRIIYKGESAGNHKHFNYAFDYVVMPVRRFTDQELETFTGKKWNLLKKELTRAGFVLSFRDGRECVEDFPAGVPSIIEIMTSSTSGGNKKKRSAIPMAFEDAILGRSHAAPGINFRQVWARMVSQLIVKSEVGIGWGGKTLWLVQDLLLDYMSQSTALRLKEFVSEHTSEVNLLSFSYGDEFKKANGVIELSADVLYAGPISQDSSPTEKTHSFQDILKAPILPPIQHLVNVLRKRKMTIVVIAP
jgi:hypothetical protein